MAGEDKACRQTQVSEQFARLANAVERSISLRSDIESRFTTVLRNDPPVGKDQMKDLVVAAYVPLAEEIKSLAVKVIANNDAMESILNRVEL